MHSNSVGIPTKAAPPVTRAQVRLWNYAWLDQLEKGGAYPYKDHRAFNIRNKDGSIERKVLPFTLTIRSLEGTLASRVRPVKPSQSNPKHLYKSRFALKTLVGGLLEAREDPNIRYAVYTSGSLCPLSRLRGAVKDLHARIGDLHRRLKKKKYPVELLLVVVEPQPSLDDANLPRLDAQGELLFNVHANVLFTLTGRMEDRWSDFWAWCRNFMKSHLHDCGPVRSIPQVASYILKPWNLQAIIDAGVVVPFHAAVYRNPLVKPHGSLRTALLEHRRLDKLAKGQAGTPVRASGPRIYDQIPDEIYLATKEFRLVEGYSESANIFMVPEKHLSHVATAAPPVVHKYTPVSPDRAATTSLAGNAAHHDAHLATEGSLPNVPLAPGASSLPETNVASWLISLGLALRPHRLPWPLRPLRPLGLPLRLRLHSPTATGRSVSPGRATIAVHPGLTGHAPALAGRSTTQEGTKNPGGEEGGRGPSGEGSAALPSGRNLSSLTSPLANSCSFPGVCITLPL
jgi:hypothetical protein